MNRVMFGLNRKKVPCQQIRNYNKKTQIYLKLTFMQLT